MTGRGRFITLEGGEGAGKSTQARLLAAELQRRGIEAVVTREPGGSPGAEDIRKLVVEGAPERWEPLVETLMFFAARADHVAHTIRPALERGAWVICDRFTDSTYAYQGAGGGLPRETIRRIEAIAVPNVKPDLTLILDLPVETGLQRAAARRQGAARFESFDMSFHQRLHDAFRDIARHQPQRCATINASGSQEEVAAEIWKIVSERCHV